MSAGDEITIVDVTHPNKLKVRRLFLVCKLEPRSGAVKFALIPFLVCLTNTRRYLPSVRQT